MSNDPAPAPAEPSCVAHDLVVAYGKTTVLDGVSLELRPGRMAALVGPNGAGKSTLLRTLLGQIKPKSGTVHWQGDAVRDLSPRELARRVAYLPQSPASDAMLNVAQALLLGRTPHLGLFGIERDEDRAAAARVAKRLGLEPLLGRMLDTLSGGQRQRVMIGRALVQEPRALLLDEPDTFLDLRAQEQLMRLLSGLCREDGLAILLASHDLNLAAAWCDEVIVLHEGVAKAAGAPGDVIEPGLLSEVYQVPVRVDVIAGAPVVTPASPRHAPARVPDDAR